VLFTNTGVAGSFNIIQYVFSFVNRSDFTIITITNLSLNSVQTQLIEMNKIVK